MPIWIGRCVGRERRVERGGGKSGGKEGVPSPSSAARRRFSFLIRRRQSLVGAGEVAPNAASHSTSSPARSKPSTPSSARRCGRCRKFAQAEKASTTLAAEEGGGPSSSHPNRTGEAPSGGPSAGGATGEGPVVGTGKSSRKFKQSKKVHRQESGSGTAGGGSGGSAAPTGGGRAATSSSAATPPNPPTSSTATPPTRRRHHQHHQQQNNEEDPAAVAEGGGSMAHASSTGSVSLATWVVKRVQNLRLFQPKRDELDPEELEMLQPARCRPERLEAIRRATRFSRKEIQFVYRAFKQECPSGMVTEDTFKAIYAKFFPQGDSSQYAHYVFNTLDRNKTGTITFTDIMLSLSILLKGSLQERIRWAFSLYDVNDDGYVTKEELSEVITAIYDLIGDHQRISPHRGSNAVEGEVPVPETPNDHVDRMFKKLDLNHDGVITVDEFIDYCSTNDNIRSSFAVFDDLW